MEYLYVLIAAAGAYAFGAVYYMVLANPWMAAAGLTREDTQRAGKSPFIISAVMVVLVAGMMRHLFTQAGIPDMGKGILTGLGIGLFFITPWIAINNAYGVRKMSLTIIDGGYATIGCGIIGGILAAFGIGAAG